GLDGALTEIGRIPAAVGLSGSLEALPLVDLFHTIRDRRLRGRLELCLDDDHGGYVLYIDGTYLQDIDALGGDTDELLLEILHESGVIGDETYQRFRRFQEEDDGLSAPLIMRLRAEQVVTEEELKMARGLRAEALFGHICGNRRGNFTFIEIQQGSAQAWPIHQLGLSVDEMLLKLVREYSIDTGQSEATARTSLIMDVDRTEALDPETLTGTERALLEFFRSGETLDKARQEFGGDSGEPVDEVIQRLKSVELLRRRKTHQNFTVKGEAPVDPHLMQTAVKADFEAGLPDTSEEEGPVTGVLVPEGSFAGPDEKTHQRTDFEAGLPDDDPFLNSRELDELISEAIADLDEDDDED
ncbi:MAG: DUF4388 domain-containing protein, partial [Bradymonadaceae bacterium]